MIKFNEITWYSKLAAIIFFIGVLPTLTFYIGIKYQQTKDISEVVVPYIENKKIESAVSSSRLYKGDSIEFEYPSNYSIKDTWVGSEYERFEISNGIITFMISNVPQGVEGDWTDYAPLENINSYDVSYLYDGQDYRIIATNKDTEYYIFTLVPSEKDARDPVVKAILQNILFSLREI